MQLAINHYFIDSHLHRMQLLAPEIRHEENALLQCIRHITTNNFFTGQEPSISGTSS